jgi:RNA polymerase sigma factor (sigma-70 family)
MGEVTEPSVLTAASLPAADMTSIDEYDAYFRRVMPRALVVAYRLVGERGTAEDVAVEALGRAFADWERVRDLPHRDAWALRVTANVALDELRRRKRQRAAALLPVAQELDHADTVALRRRLVPALARLSPRQRETVVLLYIADLSRDEVAEVMGCSAESVKTHRDRAVRKLRGDLSDAPWAKEENDG